jgi:phage baseplate assembly protein W
LYPECPHFSFPFQRSADGTSVQVVEQDTPEDIMCCENVIVHCPLGWRDDRPEFGWAWPELANVPLNVGSLEQALEQFEPRGDANAQQWLGTAAGVVNVLVSVKMDTADSETQTTG